MSAAEAPLRVLLADDEPAVRDELRHVLGGIDGVLVAAECRNGEEALAGIRSGGIDAALLDVRMPGLTGVEVLAALDEGARPPTAFVTAHDEFAVRAFELHAVDYLLKPFDEARVRLTIARLRQRAAPRAFAPHEGIEAALRALLEAAPRHPDRFVVSRGGRLRVVAAADVEWIEAADNYVRLHGGGEGSLLRETLRSLESRLDPRRFARVHRSAIVNLARVRDLRPLPSGDWEIALAGGDRVPMSRIYRDAVLQRLAGDRRP